MKKKKHYVYAVMINCMEVDGILVGLYATKKLADAAASLYGEQSNNKYNKYVVERIEVIQEDA